MLAASGGLIGYGGTGRLCQWHWVMMQHWLSGAGLCTGAADSQVVANVPYRTFATLYASRTLLFLFKLHSKQGDVRLGLG